QQTSDQVLGANFELLGQVLHADAFRDGDAASNGRRLIRHRHARRWDVALHWALFHTAGDIALSRPARRTSRASAGTSGTWGRGGGPYTEWTRAGGRLPRRMHGPAFPWTQGRTCSRRTTRGSGPLENRLPRHRTAWRGTWRSSGRRRGRSCRTRWRLINRPRTRLRNDHARLWRLRCWGRRWLGGRRRNLRYRSTRRRSGRRGRLGNRWGRRGLRTRRSIGGTRRFTDFRRRYSRRWLGGWARRNRKCRTRLLAGYDQPGRGCRRLGLRRHWNRRLGCRWRRNGGLSFGDRRRHNCGPRRSCYGRRCRLLGTDCVQYIPWL